MERAHSFFADISGLWTFLSRTFFPSGGGGGACAPSAPLPPPLRMRLGYHIHVLYRLYCLAMGGILFGYDMGRSGYHILYRLYCLTMGGILFGYDMGLEVWLSYTVQTVLSVCGRDSFWL